MVELESYGGALTLSPYIVGVQMFELCFLLRQCDLKIEYYVKSETCFVFVRSKSKLIITDDFGISAFVTR